MSKDKYVDDCPGCRPALLDPETHQLLPPESPDMQAVMRAWEQMTRDEKQSFHNFTCLNSRTPKDMAAVKHLAQMISVEIKKFDRSNLDIQVGRLTEDSGDETSVLRLAMDRDKPN